MARKAQPKCGREGCNHAYSFHRNGKSKCCVTNCKCTKWIPVEDTGPEEGLSST